MLDPLRFSDPIVRVYEECVDELLINLARHFNVKATGITESFQTETDLNIRFFHIDSHDH